MRNLFVCTLLALLAWISVQGPDPVVPPLVGLGLLAIVAAVATRLPLLGQRFGHVGALAAGILLAWTGLISPAGFQALRPYADTATVWLGLTLGASLPFSLLRSRRLLLTVAVGVIGPSLLCFLGLVVVVGTRAEHALPLALLASLPAPIFVHLVHPARKQALWLCLMSTGGTLVAWLVLVGPLPSGGPYGSGAAIALLLWAIGAEGLCRVTNIVRSGPGTYLLHGAAALALSAAASATATPGLFLGLATGLYLSARCARSRADDPSMMSASRLVSPLVLAYFSGRLPVAHVVGAPATYLLLAAVFLAAIVLGRSAAVLVGARLTPIPLRDWLHALPLGVPAGIVLVSAAFPAGMPGPNPGALAAVLVCICGVGLSLVVWPLEWLAVRVGFLRHPPA